MEQREGNGGREEDDGNAGREPDIRSEQEEEEISLYLNVCSRTGDGGHHMTATLLNHRWVCMSVDI